MAKKLLILIIAAAAFWAVWTLVRPYVGGPTLPPKQVDPVPAQKTSWTAEDIAADPEGYMQWADARVQAQLDDRQRRLTALTDRIAEVERKEGEFTRKLSDVRNVEERFTTAVRRAEDEDRWPLKIAGQSFDEAKARAIIAQAQRYIADHQPLAEAYTAALEKLHLAHSEQYRDIEHLQRLRQKLALDLERVRLNQGIEELTRLRQTEQEIAGFAGALGQMADDATLLALPPDDPASGNDLEKLMK